VRAERRLSNRSDISADGSSTKYGATKLKLAFSNVLVDKIRVS